MSRSALPLALAAALLTLPPGAEAQSFDSDNVVLLSYRPDLGFSNDVWGFVGTDGREYVIQGLIQDGTAFWDVEDPIHPVHVATVSGPNHLNRDMKVMGNYCYVASEGGAGIQIIDVSDPTNPTLVNNYTATMTYVHNLTCDPARNLIYVSGVQNELRILDATDPVNLVEVGQYADGGYVHDVSFVGNVAHLNHISNNQVTILDCTDPGNPVPLGVYADPVGASHSS